MFTGIITDVGEIRTVARAEDWRVEITTAYDPDTIDVGASIMCSGVCLTVVARGRDAGGAWFSADVSEETRRCSTASGWAAGTRLNLERSLRVGDELGGHVVLGHVDGVGTVEAVTPEKGSLKYRFRPPADLAYLIAHKGSVAIDGVSLTVNDVGKDTKGDWFEVNIIPHTQSVTTLGTLMAGSSVNLEADVLARYVARLKEAS